MNVVQLIATEVRETVRRPSRLLKVFRVSRLLEYVRFQRLRLLSTNTWSKDGSGVATRAMGSYEGYLELQKSKLRYIDLSRHERRFRDVLRDRLRERGDIRHGARVLCLGARLGAEVAAFRDLGCFAIGVDL